MIANEIFNHPSYKYATDVVNNNIISAKYIKKACQNFINDINNPDCKYMIDEKQLNLITGLTKLINMSTGLRVGMPAYEALAGFQWFFLVNALCWFHKDRPEKRRYEKSVLLIARKSGKTFLVGLIFIILMIIEPKLSEFYSVAPDRELSSIVKKEIANMIDASPAIQKYFTVIRSEVRCDITKSKFTPLATSENRMDGRLANVFVADEVGALKNRYPISAMESSQMNLVNRTGILISTAYESLINPMTEEIEYAEKVLDGLIEDDELFALLYKPDDNEAWLTDEALLQANPLAIDLPENFEQLKKQRKKATEIESEEQNFKTKHMNIFVDGAVADVYVPLDKLQQGRFKSDSYNWNGKDVYVGVDLAQSTDNTAVSMVTYDVENDCYVGKVWAFLPIKGLEKKIRAEKVNYYQMKEAGNCFFSGDDVVKYREIEDFVMSLPKQYGVNIKCIGYDRYNCIASANRWFDEGFDVLEVKQYSSSLHAPTKLFKESVLQKRFFYEQNKLFEFNVKNAREMKDSMLNTYLNKKQSRGKIDMLAATINAMYLWNQELETGYTKRDPVVVGG